MSDKSLLQFWAECFLNLFKKRKLQPEVPLREIPIVGIQGGMYNGGQMGWDLGKIPEDVFKCPGGHTIMKIAGQVAHCEKCKQEYFLCPNGHWLVAPKEAGHRSCPKCGAAINMKELHVHE